MNNGVFIGRVGQDAELRYTNSGRAVASFSLAVDQGKDSNGEKRKPIWLKATLWEKRAESLAQYITKGKLVMVMGPVGVEAWIGKDNGEAQAKLVVTVREFEFLGGTKSENQQQADDNDGFDSAPAAEPPARPSAPLTDDDIPF